MQAFSIGPSTIAYSLLQRYIYKNVLPLLSQLEGFAFQNEVVVNKLQTNSSPEENRYETVASSKTQFFVGDERKFLPAFRMTQIKGRWLRKACFCSNNYLILICLVSICLAIMSSDENCFHRSPTLQLLPENLTIWVGHLLFSILRPRLKYLCAVSLPTT